MSKFFTAARSAALIVAFVGAATYAAPALALDVAAVPALARTVGFADLGEPSRIHLSRAASPALAGAGTTVAPRTLGELVEAHAATQVHDPDIECLAGAVYFESKGEPLEGQLAVAEVVINRANSGRYPGTYCGVVKQKSQFSFVRRGQIPPIKRSSTAWAKAVGIARVAARDLADGAASSALFFHARYVSPSWRGLKRVATIGNHIFYR